MTKRFELDSFLNYKGEGRISITTEDKRARIFNVEEALILLADLRQEVDDVQAMVREKQDEKESVE